SDISIRGANSQSALLLIDGRPINTGYFGGADLSLIPVSQIEKVQVIKGPASVRYGANSLGGIVNIVTRGGVYTSPQVTVRGLFGGLGHRELNGAAGGNFGNYTGWITVEDVGWNGTPLSNDFSADGNEDGGTRSNSDLERKGINLKVARNFHNRGYLSLMAGHVQAKKGLPGSTVRDEYWRFVDWRRSGGNISNLYYITRDLHLKSSLFANLLNDELVSYRDETYSYDNIKFDSQMRSLTWGGSLELDWNGLNAHELAAGVKVSTDRTKRRDIDKGESWTHSSDRTVSVYMEDNYQPGSNVMLTAGVGSYSYYMKETDRSISSLGFMTGLSRRWNGDITTRLAASRSVFFPTQHNLYSPGRGNPDLQPEEARKYELSLEFDADNRSGTHSQFLLTVFLQQTTNQIDLSPVSGMFVNRNRMVGWGIETGFNREVNRWFDLECTLSTLNWTTNDWTLYNTPHLKLSGRLSLLAQFRTRGYLEASWFGKRRAPADGDDSRDMPAYVVLNGNASHSLNRWTTLKLVVRNIFDAYYEEVYGYPGPGRQVLGGVELKLL
ncbi:MAG TPA: hypothetical protein ENL08_01250, partial [Bacteroidetes bacterium]|nr:hypothetical protein [Bacteroidota bacterium]